MRYRLNEDTGVIHDTRTACDDAHKEGLTPLRYLEFREALLEGLNPCDHCFRDDDDGEPDIEPVSDAAETASD